MCSFDPPTAEFTIPVGVPAAADVPPHGPSFCGSPRWSSTSRDDGSRSLKWPSAINGAVPINSIATEVNRISFIRFLPSSHLRQRHGGEGALSPIGYADGSVNTARRPPSGDDPSAIDPPYSSTRSATIASPNPDPGAASSARTPRFSTLSRSDGSSPGPSSSTVVTIEPSVTPDRTSTRDLAHLHALSTRLPSISS